ncbi:MAG: BBP7 family outer membrane beta-barrel protein [Planctomycetota bacterium]
MRRMWQQCLALIAVAAWSGIANAQWEQQPEIGSYQSILSRAGYGQQHMGTLQQGAVQQGAVHQGALQQGTVHQGAMQQGVQMPAHNGVAVQNMQLNTMPVQNGMHGSSMNMGTANGAVMGGQVGVGCATGGVVTNGAAMGNVVSGGMVGGPVQTTTPMVDYTDYGSAGMAGSAGCGPVYVPGASSGLGAGFFKKSGLGGGRQVNRVGSIFGVVLNRNYEDDVRLGYNGAGQEVFSGDIDEGNMSGLGASLITRSANGNGWEFVYWGVDDDTDISLAGPTYTNLTGLADLNHVPSGFNMLDIFNNGTDARFYRDTEINSVAFNLLRNGGNYCTRRGKQANFELLGGFRLFQFDESFRYVSNANAPYPLTSDYQLQAENLLVGLQVGGRNEVCLTNRLRFAGGATVGLFNNRIETRQRIIDETGYSPLLAGGPSAGRPFDYSDQKDDVAVMGELDLGLIYQVSSRMRARIGYRAFGVSGVALAVDQIPYDFNDSYLLQSANSNGSLIMQGVYFGSEYCF